jgi:hypothetical protein
MKKATIQVNGGLISVVAERAPFTKTMILPPFL